MTVIRSLEERSSHTIAVVDINQFTDMKSNNLKGMIANVSADVTQFEKFNLSKSIPQHRRDEIFSYQFQIEICLIN